MRKAEKLFLLFFALFVLLTVSAFASGEPSAEPSGEPASVLAEEPAAAEPASFDVTFLVNGEEFRVASVGIAVEGDVYTFQVSELLELLGVELTYDEQSRVASLSPVEGGFMDTMLAQTTKEASSAASGEPAAVDDPASAEPGAPGSDSDAAKTAVRDSSTEPASGPGVPAVLSDMRKRPVGVFFRTVQ